MTEPTEARPDIEHLLAALELHRPSLMNKYGQPTAQVEEAKWIRCTECQMSVPLTGCKTWSTAYPSTNPPTEVS